MRSKFTLVIFSSLLFFACKKNDNSDPQVSKPIDFSGTPHETGCAWDDAGKPNCLLTPDVISQQLNDFINNVLPEGRDLRATNPSLLSGSAVADLAITQTSDVFITFVRQATSLNNSFAYYTFPSNTPPQTAADVAKMTFIFPNLKSNTPLVPGDKVKIGRFNAGISIGFVLLRNGWNATLKKPDPSVLHFFTNDILNPEVDPALKKHAVLVNFVPENKFLIGFDDELRTSSSCDHDFNDVVVYATVVQ